jgi:hypothetical protein
LGEPKGISLRPSAFAALRSAVQHRLNSCHRPERQAFNGGLCAIAGQKQGKIELSPSYDLLNTTIATGNALEEFAIPLHGKKRRITAIDLMDYFGKERLGLTEKVIHQIMQTLVRAKEHWLRLIEISFLSDKMKAAYAVLLKDRTQTVGI